MALIRDDFETRVAEINKYFNFLEALEDDMIILANHDNSKRVRLDDDQLKIFKANGFLLLYNLIESTMQNSVVNIFDEIKLRELSYKDLTECLKKYWFKNKHKQNESQKDGSLYNKFYDIVEDIISEITLEIINKLEYGGSIDNRRMKEIASSLGVDFSPVGYDKETHGKALVEIKKHRNDLAHGDVSFANLGKNYTYHGSIIDSGDTISYVSLGLKHYKDFTIEHLEKYINCVEQFISEERFKLAV